MFIGYKHSLDNARSVAFLQRNISTHLIEDKTFNDSGIINNLIDYEDGHKKPDSLREDTIYTGIQHSKKFQNHVVKRDTNSERSLKFQKGLRSCISVYRDIHKQLTNRLSSQKLISYCMVPKKSIESVSSSDFELIHHKKMRALECDE
ncbi:uncharacterized protein TNCV_3183781 [Trichonephila clavipes]|nr:uncharacterized protein TNCV_3183781 [Trichonephila clavipes]